MYRLAGIKSIFLVAALIFSVTVSAVCSADSGKVELSVSFPDKAKSGFGADVFGPWGEAVKSITQGRVTYTLFGSQSLNKIPDAFEATVSGVADVNHLIEQAIPGRFLLADIFTLPGIIPNQAVANQAYRELMEMYPQFLEQYKGVKVLWASVNMPADLHSKVPIKSLSDLKGKIIGCQNAASASALKALGASASIITIAEAYSSLERGVIDGAVVAWGTYWSWRLFEVTKHHTLLHIAPVTSAYIANEKKLAKISPADQNAILMMSKELGPNLTARCNANTRSMVLAREATKEKGHEFYELSIDDKAKATASYKPIWDKWVAEVTKAGYPGQKILDDLLRLIEKYKNS